MPKSYRLFKVRYADTAFDGEGAATYGGRWNSKRIRMVYTSDSRALAALESLAHTDRSIPVKWLMGGCEFPQELVQTIPLAELPAGWQDEPPNLSSQEIGNRWVESGSSAVLRVPSVLIPAEYNYLLNPTHRDFSRIRLMEPASFAFDPRLV